MITGLTHPGVTVSNLENWLAFVRNVLEANHIQSQVSDQAYLSKVTGLDQAKLNIGFIRFTENTFPLEVIEYSHPRGSLQKSSVGCVGHAHLGFQVQDILSIHQNCATNNILASEIEVENHPYWGRYQCFQITAPDGIHIKILHFEQSSLQTSPVQIHHTGLTVSDLKGAKELMVNNLGLEIVFQGSKVDNATQITSISSYESVLLKVPDQEFTIELRKANNLSCASIDMGHHHPGCLHHCFQVDDIQRDYSILKEAGVAFVGQPAEVTAGVNKGAFAIYFIGFDGYRFEIFQKPQ